MQFLSFFLYEMRRLWPQIRMDFCICMCVFLSISCLLAITCTSITNAIQMHVRSIGTHYLTHYNYMYLQQLHFLLIIHTANFLFDLRHFICIYIASYR